MSANGFDESGHCLYSGIMPRLRVHSAYILLAGFLCGCSFNYSDAADASERFPDIVLDQVSAYRYENAELSIVLSAKTLEMYDSDRMWAGEGISFVQYDSGGERTVAAEGSAGYLIVDDRNSVYSLAGESVFHVVKDGIFLRSSGLKWLRNEHLLLGLTDGLVEVEKQDGSTVRGTGFAANTLGRMYSFSGGVDGLLVTGSSADGADFFGGEEQEPAASDAEGPAALPADADPIEADSGSETDFL